MDSAPLSVRLGPSALLSALLIIGHLLAIIALAVSLDGLALAAAAAGVALSAVQTIGEALRCRADSPRELQLHDGGRAAWLDRDGRWHDTAVAQGGYVSPWLILVPLAGSGKRRKWIVIPPDAASRDDQRRLRVWLRWQPGANTPG